MTTYYVPTTTPIVDGDTFCGGACTSSDVIIIEGGERGNLLFKDFNGDGSYITIANEDSATRGIITESGSAGLAALNLENCAYIDLRGNNSSSWEYGIKVVINTGSALKVYNEGDHIKLSYLEIDGNGIHIGDPDLTASSIFDTFEIHHNYIHDTIYSGMYLGMNLPPTNNNPYIANVSVHDNLLEDMGSYGITLKGVHSSSGKNLIYNNTIQGSSGGQSTGLVTALGDDFKFGIGGTYYYGSNGVDVYNNRIDKTVGSGIHASVKNQNIYDNTICGCGSGDNPTFGHGILTQSSGAQNVHIYDNIIIQPKRYGVYARGTTISALMSRNLIGDAGVGEWYDMDVGSGDLTESTGEDANWYEADVDNFGFNAWSDDGDYSNDDFTFGGNNPYTRHRGILRQKPKYNMVGGRFR